MTPITNIRKAVSTLANRLNKKIQNLSSAFIRAWQIIKGRVLLSKVAGVSFGSRPAALAKATNFDRARRVRYTHTNTSRVYRIPKYWARLKF